MQQTRRQYTLDDYLSLQRGIEVKLEYFNGEIYLMAGGSAGHNRISRNVLKLFDAALAGSPCEVFGSDMRVSTPSASTPTPTRPSSPDRGLAMHWKRSATRS